MRMYYHLHQRTDELGGHAAAAATADVVLIHRVAVTVLLAAVLGVVVLRGDNHNQGMKIFSSEIIYFLEKIKIKMYSTTIYPRDSHLHKV